jgi:hypothetical protein
MTFKVTGAIFKNTPEKLQQRLGARFEPNKNYPNVEGLFGIKEQDRLAFARYVMNAELNEQGEIPVRISGYNNVGKETGIKYLGLTFEPDWKTQKAIEEKLAAASAAQSLATATDGVVVAVNDDDLF